MSRPEAHAGPSAAAPLRFRAMLLALALALACGDDGLGATEGTMGETGETGEDSGTSTADAPDMARCAPISAMPTGMGPPRLERIATREQIPGLADQPTARGQTLSTLFAFDGRMHLGYGDYGDNTGPIAMSAWEPGLGAFVSMGTLPTEEVQWLRAGNGALYSPAIDPDGHQEDGGIYRLDCGATTWTVGTPIDGAVHVYDVAVQGEAIYASTGSMEGQPALVVRSEDHGEHWVEVLRRESAPDRFSRLYFMGATPELLFVSGRDHPAPSTVFAWVRRGQGPFEAVVEPPADSLVPIILGDQIVIAGFLGAPGRGTYLGSYQLEGPDPPPRRALAWGGGRLPGRVVCAPRRCRSPRAPPGADGGARWLGDRAPQRRARRGADRLGAARGSRDPPRRPIRLDGTAAGRPLPGNRRGLLVCAPRPRR